MADKKVDAPIPSTVAAARSPARSRSRSRSPAAERRVPVAPEQQQQQNAVAEGLAELEVSPTPAVHKCMECDASFRSIKAMWGHTHIHTREREIQSEGSNLKQSAPTSEPDNLVVVIAEPAPPKAVVDSASVTVDKGEGSRSQRKKMLPDLNLEAPEDSDTSE